MEYGLFKDTPTLQGQFEKDMELALKYVDPLEASKDPQISADGHFAEGMAEGTKGQWQIMRGHWVGAYWTGKRAMKHLNKALKIDPNYYDADLGAGAFYYQASHFGKFLKVVAAVGGIHGDEKKGLEMMELAASRGRYGARQAAQLLSTIYITDRRDFAKALPHIQRLRSDFPESPYFEFIEAMLQFKLGHLDESLVMGREIFDRSLSNPIALNRKLLGLTCGLTGDQCLAKADVEQGRVWFTHAIELASDPKPGKTVKVTEADRQWLSVLHLYRGYASSILDKKDEADRDYRWVLDHPDFSDDHARAQECMGGKCDAKSVIAYLRAMSNGDAWPAKK
jgi:tetratricopeptide (TPR) repeat protein